MNNAHINAQIVADNKTNHQFNSHWADFHPAGGTITSDGNGINELSIAINNQIV